MNELKLTVKTLLIRYNTNIIINQNIRMISEESNDTEGWSNGC